MCAVRQCAWPLATPSVSVFVPSHACHAHMWQVGGYGCGAVCVPSLLISSYLVQPHRRAWVCGLFVARGGSFEPTPTEDVVVKDSRRGAGQAASLTVLALLRACLGMWLCKPLLRVLASSSGVQRLSLCGVWLTGACMCSWFHVLQQPGWGITYYSRRVGMVGERAGKLSGVWVCRH